VSGFLRDSALRRQLEEKVKEATRTRGVAEEALKAAREVLDAAKRIDADIGVAQEPLAEAESAFGAKDYRLAADKAAEAKERGQRLYRGRAEAIVTSSESLANLARSVGGELGEAESALKKARDALSSDDLTNAVDQAKKAWKRGEKVLHEHLSLSFSKAQSLILTAKNLGREVAPIEDLLSRARTGMDSNDYDSAVSFTKEALATITDDLRANLDGEMREAEDLMRTAQELGADVTRPSGLIERARGDLENLDFEKARNAFRQSRGESEKALQKSLDGKVANFAKFLDEATGLGAETSAAAERFDQAEAAIKKGDYKTGGRLAKEGFQVVQQAQFTRVLQTVAASREKFVAAMNLGADVSGPVATLNKAREALQRNAFREAIDWAKKADEGVEQVLGRYRSAELKLRDLHRAMAEAEALGVSTTNARRFSEQAREAYQNRNPDGLDRALGSALEELRRSEHERTMQSIEQAEFILTLGERNEADLGEAQTLLEGSIVAAKAQEYRKALDLAGKAASRADDGLRRRVADGLAVLRNVLPHLGEEASTVKVLLNRAEASVTARDFEGAFGAIAEARGLVERRTAGLASQAVEDLGTIVAMGLDLGADIGGVEALYKELNGHLGAGRPSEVLAGRDRVRSTLATASDGLFNLVKNRVAQARDLKIDIEEMRDLLKRSKVALSIENYHEGLGLLRECNDRARKATAMYRQAQTALASAAAFAAEARKRDVDVGRVLEILLEGKRAFEQLDYGKSIDLAAKARAETGKLLVLYTSAQKIVSSRERMDLATRLGIDAPHLRDALTDAKESMKAKDYERALANAQRVEQEITSLIGQRIASLLEATEAAVGSVQGANLAALNDEIVKARQYLGAGQFAPAADASLRLKDQLDRLTRQGEEADGAIRRVRELIADAEGMNVELVATSRLLERSLRAFKMAQFDEALDHAAQAEAEATKERDQAIASLMAQFQESIERAKREGTDTRSAERLLDRAREFLRGKKYRQALALAEQSEGEAERIGLQQKMAAQALQTAERKLQGLGFPVPPVAHALDEAKRGFASADYVKALDAAIKASDALTDIRNELGELHKARDRVQALLATVQEVGAETVKLIQIFDEGEAALHVGDVTKARAAYAQATEWATGVLKNHLRDLLARASGITETGRRMQIDPTAALNHLAEARSRIEAGDFGLAYKAIQSGQRIAEVALGTKLNEAILQAADNVTHAKKLGTDAREAEDILRQARARIERMEYDGALELTERALEKVESVKVVEKRFVDLTYKAESTIRNGKKFGVDMRPAERRLADSMALRKTNLADAIKAAEEAYRLGWDAVEEFAPAMEAGLEMGPTKLNEWTDATLTLMNVGKGLAKDVRVKILGDAETEGLQDVPAVRAKGQESLRIRIKMTASGSVPLAIQITSHRVLDDKAYTQEMIAQIEVAEDAIERPKRLVADLETRCPICKGMIKKGFKVLRCGCGRDFHELCASRIGRCPACFRPLGTAAG